ncbi:MAG: hypothetical protein H7248_03160 [Microbacteriaceae bacterium]|nr:hypothetical protein [Microbacteriaceae bacterium]
MTQTKSRFVMLLTGVTVIAVLSGCVSISAPVADPGHPAMSPFQHIHGLALDRDAGFGLVATHEGLFRFPITGAKALTPAEVGKPQGGIMDDFMGLTSIDGTLFASGHPHGEQATAGPNLGLRQSIDAGSTWSAVSATPTADYHALTVGKGDGGSPVIYGLDSGSEGISSSADGGRSWIPGAALAARNITADPNLPNTVYATTQTGVQISHDAGKTFVPVTGAPALYLLAAIPNPATGTLIGVDVDGTVWLKPATLPWKKTGSVSGQASAIAIAAGTDPKLLVSDDSGIAVSSDLGASWRLVVTP